MKFQLVNYLQNREQATNHEEMTNYIMISTDQSNPALPDILNLSAAFDTVDNSVRFSRLKRCSGVR